MFVTRDMAFASYLVQQGHGISTVERAGRRVSWVFEITETDIARVEAAWPSSTESQFFNVYQTLKNQIRKV